MRIVDAAVDTAPVHVLETIVLKAHAWAGTATVRLARRGPPPGAARPVATAAETRHYLTVEAAADLTGLTPRWLRRHTRGLPFRRELSRKKLRFDEEGFRRWIESRRP